MLKVNLLPEGSRKASLSPIEQFHRTPLVKILAGLMTVFALLVCLPIGLRKAQLKQLEARIQELHPRKVEVERIQEILKELRTQETAFQTLKQEGGSWAKRFNVLSDLTPDGIWYTELVLDEVSGLVIQGSAIGQGGSEMVKVGRLVQDLKLSPDFAAVVNDIQIESITRVQEKDVELVQFTLTCALLPSTVTGTTTP
jgi:hypothetical protein